MQRALDVMYEQILIDVNEVNQSRDRMGGITEIRCEWAGGERVNRRVQGGEEGGELV